MRHIPTYSRVLITPLEYSNIPNSLYFITHYTLYLFNSGNIVDTVIFQPIPDQSTQQRVITITFPDDNIALEANEIRTFRLANASGAVLSSPSQTSVTIIDDDRK